MKSYLVIEIKVPLAGESVIDKACEIQDLKMPLEQFRKALPDGTASSMRVVTEKGPRRPKLVAAE